MLLRNTIFLVCQLCKMHQLKFSPRPCYSSMILIDSKPPITADPLGSKRARWTWRLTLDKEINGLLRLWRCSFKCFRSERRRIFDWLSTLHHQIGDEISTVHLCRHNTGTVSVAWKGERRLKGWNNWTDGISRQSWKSLFHYVSRGAIRGFLRE